MTSKDIPFKMHKDDMRLNLWHRAQGYELPATNIDWFVEYNWEIPKALIEYKRLSARRFDAMDWNYRVLRNVAN